MPMTGPSPLTCRHTNNGYFNRLVGITALTILLLAGCSYNLKPSVSQKQPILAIDFEAIEPGSAAAQLVNNKYLSLDRGGGVNGSTALRTKYVAYEMGSHRVVERILLPEHGLEYSLNFDVRFDDNFQFVIGGKLHGFAPNKPVSGGKPIEPQGWSARIMFKKKGAVNTYSYHQDQKGKYGDRGERTRPFYFQPGHYHAVSLHVKINEDPVKASGFSRIYIDGKLVEAHEGIRFRAARGPKSEIHKLLFSTFHGGNTPRWAPLDSEGNYKDLYANFDNFAVYRGMRIRQAANE